jgi:hypothetical protein
MSIEENRYSFRVSKKKRIRIDKFQWNLLPRYQTPNLKKGIRSSKKTNEERIVPENRAGIWRFLRLLEAKEKEERFTS